MAQLTVIYWTDAFQYCHGFHVIINVSFTLSTSVLVTVQTVLLPNRFILKVHNHGVQRRVISVDNFFIFLGLLFFALLLLYVT